MVAEDTVRVHLSQLDVWKSMEADKMYLKVLREETNVILRPLSSLKDYGDLWRFLMTHTRFQKGEKGRCSERQTSQLHLSPC